VQFGLRGCVLIIQHWGVGGLIVVWGFNILWCVYAFGGLVMGSWAFEFVVLVWWLVVG